MARILNPWARWLPLPFLLIFFALGLRTAVALSPTMDEPVHLLRGGALWQTGDTRLQYEHAPLAHWTIGALLQLAGDLPAIAHLPDWDTVQHIPLTEEFLWLANPQPNVARAFFLGRLAILLTGVLGGAVLARWARERLAWPGPAVVLVLFAFSPNLLAHFSLATTDGLLTAVYLTAVFTLWRYWQRPTRIRWLLAALALGLALAAKLTALVLLPVGLLLSYASYWQNGRRGPWQRPGLLWAAMLPVAALVVWAVYGFEIRPSGAITIPLPAATYLNSLLDLLLHAGAGHEAFLLGHLSESGWWSYFPIAFGVKTPGVTLILFAVALVLLTLRRGWGSTVYFWLPALALFLVAVAGRLNIGYRHILPVLPFVWLLVGETAVHWHTHRVTRFALLLLLGWYAAAGVWQTPHTLAYFNEFVGGPAQGYRYLGDSNLDWGQDLSALAAYLAANPGAQYSYFGPTDPAWVGVTARPLEESAAFVPANPAPGRYALSASHLQGLRLADHDLLDWFRRREPAGSLNHSILLYDVAEAAAGSWVAQCLDPGPIVPETAVPQIIGPGDYRMVYFDCANGWVLPNDGAPGWYILPQRADWPAAAWWPADLTLVYKHDAAGDSPSYSVYYWHGRLDHLADWHAAGQTAVLPDGATVPLPLRFGDTAQLTGYRQDGLDWWTGWQVVGVGETAVPLTAAGHLLTGSPPPLVADGLAYTSEQWQPGDRFWQRFAFPAPGQALETGLYNYTTGELFGINGLVQLEARD